MQFWVGTTDNNWFQYLSAVIPAVDEVNFWQPSAKPLFASLPAGTPFLFKLKAPHHHIGGGGYFVKSSVLPLSLAWETFGNKNGTQTRFEFERNLRRLGGESAVRDPLILCNIIAQPFFWPRSLWLETPEGWSKNIVRGKTYSTDQSDGQALWSRVSERLVNTSGDTPMLVRESTEQHSRYGKPTLVAPRLGQGAFRVVVAEAYERRCAITGENTLPVLEAAHIKPFSESGPHEVSNGLLLRSDFHKLFDAGLVTVRPDLTVQVSPQIHKSYFNGKVYYRLDGKRLEVLPKETSQQPDPSYLDWHNRNIYVG